MGNSCLRAQRKETQIITLSKRKFVVTYFGALLSPVVPFATMNSKVDFHSLRKARFSRL